MLVAFRTGLCTLDVGSRIESLIESSSSWSMVVGDSAAEAIDAFNKFRKNNVRNYLILNDLIANYL